MTIETLPTELTTAILFIPIIATLINITRYILGIKTFGLYPVLVLTFAYYLTGVRYGLAITTIIVVTTLLTHKVLKRIRMHYISRTAINYNIVAIILGITLYILYSIPIINQHLRLEKINIASVVLIASLSDYVIKEYINKSIYITLRSIGETVIIAVIGWTILKNPNLDTVMHTHFWIIGLLVFVNLLIGQAATLKAIDILRFKSILFKKDQTETEKQ